FFPFTEQTDDDPTTGLVIAASVSLGNALGNATTISAVGTNGAKLAIVGGNFTPGTHAMTVNGYMTKTAGQLTMSAGTQITIRDSLVVSGGQSLMDGGTISVGGDLI